MNEDRTTASASANGSISPLQTIAETWAAPAELNELDGLLNDYIDLAERLSDASAGSELTDALTAGMRAFHLLRRLNLPWSEGIHAGRITHHWEDTRGICDRYQKWSAASRRVLEQNRQARISGRESADGRLLRDAFIEAIPAASANVDDLKEAFEPAIQA